MTPLPGKPAVEVRPDLDLVLCQSDKVVLDRAGKVVIVDTRVSVSALVEGEENRA